MTAKVSLAFLLLVVLNGNLSAQDAPSNEASKAEARKLFDEVKRKTGSNYQDEYNARFADYKRQLNELEARMLEVKSAISKSERERRSSLSRVDLYTTMKLIEERQALGLKEIAKLKAQQAASVTAKAWQKLTQDEMKRIKESGCLTQEEKEAIATLVVGESKSTLPQMKNSLEQAFRQVPAGKFEMGICGQMGLSSKEHVRTVTLSKPFWIAELEVTQSQYSKVMKKNPSKNKPLSLQSLLEGGAAQDKLPVENVTWYDALEFCKKLSELPAEKDAKRFYRLPTEAEWEYACRAGTTSLFHFGNYEELKRYDANLDYSALNRSSLNNTTKVGSFFENNFGLKDMHGNVAEWCGDWYDPVYYSAATSTDPPGPSKGLVDISSDSQGVPRLYHLERKCIRGGNFKTSIAVGGESTGAACHERGAMEPDSSGCIGIRLVCEVGQQSSICQEQYEAYADYEQGRKRDVNSAAVQSHLGNLEELRAKLFVEANKGDMVEALNRLDTVYRELISTHYSLKDEIKVKELYLELAQIGDQAIPILINLDKLNEKALLTKMASVANHYQRGGNADRARELVNRVMKVQPDHELALEVQKRLDKEK